MSKIFVQPPDDENFDEFLAFAKENGYNMEIASFAYSRVLDSNWQEILQDHQQKLQGFEGIISLHGAFLDLILHSRDKKIADLLDQTEPCESCTAADCKECSKLKSLRTLGLLGE